MNLEEIRKGKGGKSRRMLEENYYFIIVVEPCRKKRVSRLFMKRIESFLQIHY